MERCLEAEQHYERALLGLEQVHAKTHPDTLGIYAHKAQNYCRQGRHDYAIKVYQRALSGLELKSGGKSEVLLGNLGRIAYVYYERKDYDTALHYYKSFGKDDPSMAQTIWEIAHVYWGQAGRRDLVVE